MVLVVFSTLLVATATLRSAAASANPKHRVVCALPRGAQVVAQDSLIRIIAIKGPISSDGARISREWRYCLRRRHRSRYRTLVDAATHGLGDIVDVGPVVLSGAYVAYNTETTAYAGRYGNNPIGVVYVSNLVRGTTKSAGVDCNLFITNSLCTVGPTDYYSCSPPDCGAGPPVLIVTSAGLAAWQAEQKCIYGNDTDWRPCAWTIQVLDGRTGWEAVLDRVPPVQGQYLPDDPFDNLSLYTCTAGCAATNRSIAAWTHSGISHTASVQ